MPQYRDAIGYLLELRNSRNESWFTKVCDIVIAANDGNFHDDTIRSVQDLFISETPYSSVSATPSPAAATPSTAPALFLERIAGFSNFKRLANVLELAFSERITIIFGKNGSGKSSLCQAFKVLANAKPPTSPLNNVRRQYPGEPTFEYTFRGESSTTWTSSTGFGGEADKLMYFDSTVALTHLEQPMDPSRSVLLTPFRLEVFEYAGTLVSKLQEQLRTYLRDQGERLTSETQIFIASLGEAADLKAEPFASLLGLNPEPMKSIAQSLPEIDDAHAESIRQLEAEAKRLAEASTETGLTALRARHLSCSRLKQHVERFLSRIDGLALPRRVTQEALRDQKQAALNEITARSFPNGEDSEDLQHLVEAAAAVTELVDAAEGNNRCPLCQRVHDASSAEQFHAYHRLLTNELLTEVRELDAELLRARATVTDLKTQQAEDFAILHEDLPEGQPEAALALVSAVLQALPDEDQPFSSCDLSVLQNVDEIRAFAGVVEAKEQGLASAVKAGEEGGETLAKQLQQVNADLQTMLLQRTLHAHQEDAEAVIGRCEEHQVRTNRVRQYDFASVMRSLSTKRKEATNELVMSSFESQLSNEYKSLSGLEMAQFGVQLNPVAEQQNVLVNPQVGSGRVRRVLSEGEQKVHALAAFFCEASQSPHRVLVFDDPVTSFDYNYMRFFCQRLRDYAIANAGSQIILLTHHWEFFVGLRKLLDQSPLSGHNDVLVLENCESARVYSEKECELITEIQQHLSGTGEPSDTAKSEAMRCMRILIEAIVNKYVFVGRRQQYKQATSGVSNFHELTKVVRLEDAEAVKLRDLFGLVSPEHHDDPSTLYTARSGDQLRSCLQDIIQIRDQIKARRP